MSTCLYVSIVVIVLLRYANMVSFLPLRKDADQATCLLFDLYKVNKLRKAVGVTEMIIEIPA